jgi:hypothetical protein
MKSDNIDLQANHTSIFVQNIFQMLEEFLYISWCIEINESSSTWIQFQPYLVHEDKRYCYTMSLRNG